MSRQIIRQGNENVKNVKFATLIVLVIMIIVIIMFVCAYAAVGMKEMYIYIFLYVDKI